MLEDKKSHTQLNTLQEYEFAKTRVMAGKVHTTEMIALRPVSDNLGLNWSGVHQSLKRDDKLSQLCVLEKGLGNDGKYYEMICLPPDPFNDWLYDLKPENYKIFNIELWELYKKKLVIYILMMLKKALDHIEMNAEANYNNEELRLMHLQRIDLEKKLSQNKSEKSAIAKLLNELKLKMDQKATEDYNQLRIPYSSLN